MNPTARITLATLAVGLIAACMIFAESGYSGEVVTPQFEINEIPLEYNGWKGNVKELDGEVFRVLGADKEISAEYQKSNEPNLFVHFAVWSKTSAITESCPHHPNFCYGGQGWQPVESKHVSITTPKESVPVQLTLFQRGFEAIVVAHNYRMGTEVFTTYEEGDKVIRGLWGAKRWPAVTKFMVQIPVADLDLAVPIVEEISPKLLTWSAE